MTPTSNAEVVLRVAQIVPFTEAEGPGVRFALWLLAAAAISLGVLALLAGGNVLATWPASMAARTSVARVLRSE